MKLKLLREKIYINGQWLEADRGRNFEVLNPFDGSKVATVPLCEGQEARRAIEAAHQAWSVWRHFSPRERAQLLQKWAGLIDDHREELAELITLECGKPIREARAEVAYGNNFVKWAAMEAMHILGETAQMDASNQRMVVIKQPVGVVAAITPWNFPLAMITRKCTPALAAGCTVVVKPAEDTPLTALALAALAEQAGFPPGVLNVLTGLPAEIGLEMSTNPLVRALSFTGSTAVGKLLMQQCSQTVKKVALELGGNAPFIVFKDADLEAALQGVMAAKFRNSGQTCICANRILVQTEIYDEFIEKLAVLIRQLVVGNGLKEETQVTALINQKGLKKVDRLVKAAVNRGARLHCGGSISEDIPLAYQPTLLTEITPHMEIFHEEIFGPVAAVMPFNDEEEVIDLANHTPYGLAGYFYSRDIGRVWRVAEALESGIVGVNSGIVSNEFAPFGGIKESGLGREGSTHGIEEFLETKYICMAF